VIRVAAFLGLCALTASTAVAQQATETAQGAVLRALDKLTGQTTDLDIASGDTRSFGRLSIYLQECRYPSGNRAGDAFAGLDIREEGREQPVFQGWMIASAPALSAMDHPQYDVWVIRCTTS
jgi:hypothetical protein